MSRIKEKTDRPTLHELQGLAEPGELVTVPERQIDDKTDKLIILHETLHELAKRREILNPTELSQVLDVEKGWVYQRCRKGHPDPLPHIKLGKYLKFFAHEIEAYVQSKHRGWTPDDD